MFVLTLQWWIITILTVAAFVVELWAFIDCLIRSSKGFVAERKLSKPIWLAITGVSALIGFTALPPLGSGGLGLLTIIGVICAFVYLADVRPAVRPYKGSQGSSGRSNSGGW